MNKIITLDRIVIGSSLEAVLCAFYNKLKLIYTRNLQPDVHDTIEDYGLGTSKHDAWNKHTFQLSLAGYTPFGDKIKHIRYVDKNTIKVITKEEGVYTVIFQELYVFDDHEFLDIPPHLSSDKDEVRILDWFKVVEGDISSHESIQNKNRFINQIIFYKDKKEVCVVSYVKTEELDSKQEHLVRVKTESILSNPGNDIILDHRDRQIFDLGKNIYEDFDNVTFSYADHKIMYDLRRVRAKIDYMKYLRIKLGIANDRDE